jgi:hypothetical protein
MSIRDLKNRSRRTLHDALAVPAIYVDRDTRAETPCTVRVHHRHDKFGDMTGFDYAPAERITTVPELIILKDDLAPTRAGVFSIASDEAYKVETVMPPDGITVTIQTTRMSQAEIDAESLPVPGAA